MRLVSLVPSITEALAQLGLADNIVGVTDYCLYPEEVVQRATRIGGTKNPDLDKIRKLEPELVIANTDEQRRETLDALADSGLDVLVTHTDSWDDVLDTWTQLGHVTDTERAAHRERHRLEAALHAAREHAARHPRLKALVPVWKHPWMASGGGTYIEALLEACGFDNLLHDIPEKWARIALTTNADVAASEAPDKGPSAGQTVHALPDTPQCVLLPTEPYAFTDDDRGDFVALGVPRARVRVVDGELLTWWLSKSVDALRTFTDLHDHLSQRAA